MSRKSISVVIPNFNGKHLLSQNLPSVIHALKTSGAHYEIILVDDFSKDDSVSFIKENYPEIQLVCSQENGGFSVSCNKGIKLASCELTMLLNTDIQLPVDYFESQFQYFEEPDTFGVMAKVIGLKNGEVQDTARFIRRSGLKIKANNFFHVKNDEFWCPTAYLSGANAIIDTVKLQAIGGFDEIYSPFYCEDFDMGLRAWRLGWKSYYQPKTYCLHDHSATTKNIASREWVKAIFFRNRLIVHSIHLSTFQRRLWMIQVLLTDVLFRWISLRLYFYKSIRLFISMPTQIKEARKNFNRLMKTAGSNRSIHDIQKMMDEMLKDQIIVNGRD